MSQAIIRQAEQGDLQSLLKLYTHLHEELVPEITPEIEEQWQDMLADERLYLIVAVDGGEVVSSCVVDIVPNLTRRQRPYGVVENVVTAPEHRGQGLATGCLRYANQLATLAGCYKLMLLTGAKDEETLRFYERTGYNRRDKTGFILWLDRPTKIVEE